MLVGINDLRGHGVFQILLDRAAQVARAVGRGIGLFDEIFLNSLVPRKVQALVLEALLQLREHDAGNAGKVLLVEAVEADDLVHAVQKFRAQELTERLHRAVAVLLVHRVAEADGALLAFAARVGRHHDNGIFKIHLAAVGVGDLSVIENLQQDVHHIGMRVSAAIRRNRVGISPKHKPVSFIFVGSTGVGKTELVKQLADDLFHAPESLIRLDMSEFMEKHSVSRIVGSPPGYVGYDEAGQLTEKIRRKPYSVVLFDEIEKAHPDVLNVLLQILDDGQITDAHGRKVNFENTVIVMTSNAGSDKSAGGTVGFGRSSDEQDKERVMKALQSFLRPEFINRVDEIVYFHQLTKDNFRGIATIMLNELAESLSAKGFTFIYDDALLDYLVEKSYSAAYGARNLRRCIQKELEDPMILRRPPPCR